jgi:hypothetical protein
MRVKSSSVGPNPSYESNENIPFKIHCQHLSNINADSQFYAGHGSVKNLVNSYEHINRKEQLEAENKILQMREERLKEMTKVMEITHKNLELNIDANDEHDESEQEYEQEEDEDEEEDEADIDEQEKLEQSQRLVEEQEKKFHQLLNRNNHHQQAFEPNNQLSTISERTEHSSSANNAMIAAAASNNTVTSPLNTNQNTNSKLGSVTKSMRHLEPYRYLDTSTGASGDGFSISKSNQTPNTTPQKMNQNSNFSSEFDNRQRGQLNHCKKPAMSKNPSN